MPRICYKEKKFSTSSKDVIVEAIEIIQEYADEGYDLTLRQLYYQFVARGLIENTDKSYRRLGTIISDARMAGLIDWDAIVDRTRHLSHLSTWGDPGQIIEGAARSYREDLWDTQPWRVEVWVEKEALAGVIERIANELRCPFFSCRGYVSQSAQWEAAQRIGKHVADQGQGVVVLHLGDHDPSGLDMTRDNGDRLNLLTANCFDQSAKSLPPHFVHEDLPEEPTVAICRIALNMDQIEEYRPPPNPAKLTDARAKGYVRNHGDESWELDALDPRVLSALVRRYVDEVREDKPYGERQAQEQEHQLQIEAVASDWPGVCEWLGA